MGVCPSIISVTLILKRAKFSRPSGQWQDEDYDVLADGKVIGRILHVHTIWGAGYQIPAADRQRAMGIILERVAVQPAAD